MNAKLILFQNAIDIINSQIKMLKEIGAEIHDHDDVCFCLDHIRYSSAADAVVAYFTESKSDDRYVMDRLKDSIRS